MWQWLLGIGMGIYIGTYYNCKPSLEAVTKLVRDNMPKQRGK